MNTISLCIAFVLSLGAHCVFATEVQATSATDYWTWVHEWLTCIQSAESAGMSRAEARQSCGQALTVSGLDSAGPGGESPCVSATEYWTWVEEWLTCIQSAESAGMSRAEARQSCGQAVTVPGGNAELLEELEPAVSTAAPHSVQ